MRTPRLTALALSFVLPLAPAWAAAGPGPAQDPAAAPPAITPAPEPSSPAPLDGDEAPGEAPPAGTRSGVLRNLQVPPPGAPADLALWHRANSLDLKLMAERAESSRVQIAASTSGYPRRLQAAVARGAVPQRRAAAVEARVLEEWTELARLLAARWRIDPTRGCRYPFLAFDNLLELADGPGKAPRLAEARGRLGECADAAEAILKQLAAANASLRSALLEVDRVAGPAPAASGTAVAEAEREGARGP